MKRFLSKLTATAIFTSSVFSSSMVAFADDADTQAPVVDEQSFEVLENDAEDIAEAGADNADGEGTPETGTDTETGEGGQETAVKISGTAKGIEKMVFTPDNAGSTTPETKDAVEVTVNFENNKTTFETNLVASQKYKVAITLAGSKKVMVKHPADFTTPEAEQTGDPNVVNYEYTAPSTAADNLEFEAADSIKVSGSCVGIQSMIVKEKDSNNNVVKLTSNEGVVASYEMNLIVGKEYTADVVVPNGSNVTAPKIFTYDSMKTSNQNSYTITYTCTLGEDVTADIENADFIVTEEGTITGKAPDAIKGMTFTAQENQGVEGQTGDETTGDATVVEVKFEGTGSDRKYTVTGLNGESTYDVAITLKNGSEIKKAPSGFTIKSEENAEDENGEETTVVNYTYKMPETIVDTDFEVEEVAATEVTVGGTIDAGVKSIKFKAQDENEKTATIGNDKTSYTVALTPTKQYTVTIGLNNGYTIKETPFGNPENGTYSYTAPAAGSAAVTNLNITTEEVKAGVKVSGKAPAGIKKITFTEKVDGDATADKKEVNEQDFKGEDRTFEVQLQKNKKYIVDVKTDGDFYIAKPSTESITVDNESGEMTISVVESEIQNVDFIVKGVINGAAPAEIKGIKFTENVSDGQTAEVVNAVISTENKTYTASDFKLGTTYSVEITVQNDKEVILPAAFTNAQVQEPASGVETHTITCTYAVPATLDATNSVLDLKIAEKVEVSGTVPAAIESMSFKDADDNEAQALSATLGNAESGATTKTFTISLVKGKTYTVQLTGTIPENNELKAPDEFVFAADSESPQWTYSLKDDTTTSDLVFSFVEKTATTKISGTVPADVITGMVFTKKDASVAEEENPGTEPTAPTVTINTDGTYTVENLERNTDYNVAITIANGKVITAPDRFKPVEGEETPEETPSEETYVKNFTFKTLDRNEEKGLNFSAQDEIQNVTIGGKAPTGIESISFKSESDEQPITADFTGDAAERTYTVTLKAGTEYTVKVTLADGKEIASAPTEFGTPATDGTYTFTPSEAASNLDFTVKDADTGNEDEVDISGKAPEAITAIEFKAGDVKPEVTFEGNGDSRKYKVKLEKGTEYTVKVTLADGKEIASAPAGFGTPAADGTYTFTPSETVSNLDFTVKDADTGNEDKDEVDISGKAPEAITAIEFKAGDVKPEVTFEGNGDSRKYKVKLEKGTKYTVKVTLADGKEIDSAPTGFTEGTEAGTYTFTPGETASNLDFTVKDAIAADTEVTVSGKVSEEVTEMVFTADGEPKRATITGTGEEKTFTITLKAGKKYTVKITANIEDKNNELKVPAGFEENKDGTYSFTPSKDAVLDFVVGPVDDRGAFDGSGVPTVNDAAMLLTYILENKKTGAMEDMSDELIRYYGNVNSDNKLAANDVSEILKKVLTPSYQFSGKKPDKKPVK